MKRRLTLSILMLLIGSGMLVMTGSAAGGYDLGWWTVNGGGETFSTGGGYNLGGTIGQADAGQTTSGGWYGLSGGFWPAADIFLSPSHAISGNAGAAGVNLSVDGSPKSVTADGLGNYSLGVPNNWTGGVTASLTGYRFWPIKRSYVKVTADQTGQDYAAYAVFPAYLGWPHPADGTTVCPNTRVGVTLLLNDRMRLPNGAFDASKVRLWLDWVDVTAGLTIGESASYPSIQAWMFYAPPSDLSSGPHLGWITYPTAGGQAIGAWIFTADPIGCAVPPGSTPEEIGPISP